MGERGLTALDHIVNGVSNMICCVCIYLCFLSYLGLWKLSITSNITTVHQILLSGRWQDKNQRIYIYYLSKSVIQSEIWTHLKKSKMHSRSLNLYRCVS
jgi:hypothetical protein